MPEFLSAVTLAVPLAPACGGTGQGSLTAYAPLAGGTTSTGAVQQATAGLGTAWGVLASQGAGALPMWGPPVLPDPAGGLWVLTADTSGGLYTRPALQDQNSLPITDQNGALLF